jgi:predicted DNA-binding transcriptional regulator AlpA
MSAKNSNEPEQWLSAREVRDMLRVTANTVRNYIRQRGFPEPQYLSPQRPIWRLSEVRAWIEARPRGMSAGACEVATRA